jgi:hypothetical protein
MAWSAFRTSTKFYYSRPAAKFKAARWAWDRLAGRGEIASMRLLDGEWFCQRPDDTMDTVEATVVRQNTRGA